MNLPALSKSGYKKHEDKLLKVVTDVAEYSMCNAAMEVAETFNRDECGVSVDGTWQRRGHTSLNGCVALISIDTRKVLDLEVMSSYCPTCRKLQKMHKNAEYVALKADHIKQCNYECSSAKMESIGAHRIFSRSVKSRQLKYTIYYGDGDSKEFLSVKTFME
ncbi:GMC_oxred_C domain-containing protein [Caerostris extrusa]|uniref:GMC_oxred_C domain-containing protein n=1 Tax=Caerostris extrusa TaxID=172846 RepID=A0AAV4SKR4_CAEEX|nr:GMC_oxred_C domain-containing protein [Caerostris extrusa]